MLEMLVKRACDIGVMFTGSFFIAENLSRKYVRMTAINQLHANHLKMNKIILEITLGKLFTYLKYILFFFSCLCRWYFVIELSFFSGHSAWWYNFVFFFCVRLLFSIAFSRSSIWLIWFPCHARIAFGLKWFYFLFWFGYFCFLLRFLYLNGDNHLSHKKNH